MDFTSHRIKRWRLRSGDDRGVSGLHPPAQGIRPMNAGWLHRPDRGSRAPGTGQAAGGGRPVLRQQLVEPQHEP